MPRILHKQTSLVHEITTRSWLLTKLRTKKNFGKRNEKKRKEEKKIWISEILDNNEHHSAK